MQLLFCECLHIASLAESLSEGVEESPGFGSLERTKYQVAR